MTEQTFKKRMYRDHMIIDYIPYGEKSNRRSCLLLAVDFYEGIFKLSPLPDGYEPTQEIYAHYSHCEFPPKKLTIV